MFYKESRHEGFPGDPLVLSHSTPLTYIIIFPHQILFYRFPAVKFLIRYAVIRIPYAPLYSPSTSALVRVLSTTSLLWRLPHTFLLLCVKIMVKVCRSTTESDLMITCTLHQPITYVFSRRNGAETWRTCLLSVFSA